MKTALTRLLLLAAAAGTTMVVVPNSAAARRAKAIEPLTAEGLPNVQAAGAIVLLSDGTELFSKAPDHVRGIASTTKIFVAMAVRKQKILLKGTTTINNDDRDSARGGARTRLPVGHSFRNIDLLRAMLVASDNRAPTALGRAVGFTPTQLVAAMNDLARSMGLTHTRFTGPSGLNGNESTPREMALAFREAVKDPVLAEIMGSKVASIRATHRRTNPIHYRNTNQVLHSQRHLVNAGKTGFTDTAGYCLLIRAKLAGQQVIMVFLGEQEKLTRYGDFKRVADWIESGAFKKHRYSTQHGNRKAATRAHGSD